MALKPTLLKREFSYSGITIPDPNPALSHQECLEIIAQTYPELTNAKIEPPVDEDGVQVIGLKPNEARKG